MDTATLSLAGAMIAFVGTHLALSHSLRAGMIRRLGEGGFMAVYSLVALITFAWAATSFGRASPAPQLWDGQAGAPWALASVLTIIATALFLASLFGNPALAGTSLSGLSERTPRGVFKVTRHPMMAAFALWGIAHILVAPSLRTIILAGGVSVLAIAGSRGQDLKKLTLHGQDWCVWMKRTPFFPKLGAFGHLGLFWVAALPVWLLLTWLHLRVAHIPAGLWLWFESL